MKPKTGDELNIKEVAAACHNLLDSLRWVDIDGEDLTVLSRAIKELRNSLVKED